MQIGIVIATNEPETVWSAFRYGVFARKQGDPVKVFLLGKGVECESLTDEKFNVGEQLRAFVGAGGQTLKDLHGVVRESERLLTF